MYPEANKAARLRRLMTWEAEQHSLVNMAMKYLTKARGAAHDRRHVVLNESTHVRLGHGIHIKDQRSEVPRHSVRLTVDFVQLLSKNPGHRYTGIPRTASLSKRDLKHTVAIPRSGDKKRDTNCDRAALPKRAYMV